MAWEEEQEATDRQEKNKLEKKRVELKEEVDQHIKHGKSLRIPDNEMKDFTVAIREEAKKKNTTPKTIIQTLIQENGQK